MTPYFAEAFIWFGPSITQHQTTHNRKILPHPPNVNHERGPSSHLERYDFSEIEETFQPFLLCVFLMKYFEFLWISPNRIPT